MNERDSQVVKNHFAQNQRPPVEQSENKTIVTLKTVRDKKNFPKQIKI